MTRTIGFLIFPDLQILDLAGPMAAFEIAGRLQPGAYRLAVMAAQPGQVASSCTAALAAGPLEPAANLDTLVVAGGAGTRQACEDPVLLTYVRQAALHARRVTSVCSGAYVLAAAGLLDGRRATTHWARSTDFARRFPAVRLEPDRIFVQDGCVWTSAGITAGIDLALALIAEDLGEAVARQTAQHLVVYHRRPGGQSQFSALLDLERPEGRCGKVLDWAREHLTEPLTVEQLADVAAMSARNFARAFAAETGVTPAKAIERLRLDAARARLDAGADSVDQIARQTGFGDSDRMRRAFLRAFGQPPQVFRRTARAAA
ncbi:MAG TPA: GlxA family transcriptional regulator [Caulobacteraceae bacterium]